MGHGGYGKRRKPKTLTLDKKSKNLKPRNATIKNQIRSVERMLRRNLPPEVKKAQEQKLEELKKQEEELKKQENDNRLRKIFLRYRKVKFFERRKIERGIRRLEKQQRTSTGQAQEDEIAEQLSKLKEDLEYVRFFPKTEKYVSLFMGGDEAELVEKRNRLREQIKANLIAAAASGKDLEETGSEDDGLFNGSDDDDDFFDVGSPREAEADDELSAELSAREQASSASGIAALGMSSDERNLRQISARALMPPPGASGKKILGPSVKNYKSRFAGSSSSGKNFACHSNRVPVISTSSNTSSSVSRRRGVEYSTAGNSGNLSSNSDARKPKRKRRPKKKKQQAS